MFNSSIKLYSAKALLAVGIAGLLYFGTAGAGVITPEMQKKIDAYTAKATTMATNPVLVQSVKEANAKGPIPGMDNAKWEKLADNSPEASEMVNNAAGKLLTKWMNEDADSLNKLVLTGKQGNRFAFTSKPVSYMSKDNPHFSESFAGNNWQMKETQPDPSTKIETVQITVPVKDGGNTIGVLLLSLTADNLRK